MKIMNCYLHTKTSIRIHIHEVCNNLTRIRLKSDIHIRIGTLYASLSFVLLCHIDETGVMDDMCG